MKKLKDQVAYCLKHFPETRNSDITLTLKIWEVFFPTRIRTGASGKKGVWLQDIYDLPREDNVKRVRAHYQNDQGLWLPTEWRVAKQRKINEEVWRREMATLKIADQFPNP